MRLLGWRDRYFLRTGNCRIAHRASGCGDCGALAALRHAALLPFRRDLRGEREREVVEGGIFRGSELDADAILSGFEDFDFGTFAFGGVLMPGDGVGDP